MKRLSVFFMVIVCAFSMATFTACDDTAATVSSVTISGESLVYLGSTITLAASVTMSDDTIYSGDIVWESSDESVATVSDGVVSGISEGQSNITATAGSVISTAFTVTVSEEPSIVVSVMISGETSVYIGSTITLTADVTMSGGSAYSGDIIWASSDESVAAVSKGVVSGISEGQSNITATADGVISIAFAVTVSERPSDVVTEDDWNAAFSYSSYLNATMHYTFYSKAYDVATYSVAKTALKDMGNYIEGNAYSYDYWGADYIVTEYEVLTSDSYSYVNYDGDVWVGQKHGSPITSPIRCEAFSSMVNTGILTTYSLFTYNNGLYEYKVTDSSTGTEIVTTAKIIDGYVTSLVLENTNYIITCEYSDYGTTVVDVPEEYTYDYYFANNA